MTSFLTVLEFGDYLIIAGIVLVISGATASLRPQAVRGAGPEPERRLRALEQKLDLLLQHHGIRLPPPPASGLSAEVERLACSPDTKIAAIKLYREQTPGVGLAEAKARIEAFAAGR